MQRRFKLVIDKENEGNKRVIQVIVESQYRATVTDEKDKMRMEYTYNSTSPFDDTISDTNKVLDYIYNAVGESKDNELELTVNSNSDSVTDKDFITIADSLVTLYKGKMYVHDGSELVQSSYDTMRKYLK